MEDLFDLKISDGLWEGSVAWNVDEPNNVGNELQ